MNLNPQLKLPNFKKNPFTFISFVLFFISFASLIASLVFLLITVASSNKPIQKSQIKHLLNQEAIDQAAALLIDKTVQFVPEATPQP